jgi:hypothetical protein
MLVPSRLARSFHSIVTSWYNLPNNVQDTEKPVTFHQAARYTKWKTDRYCALRFAVLSLSSTTMIFLRTATRSRTSGISPVPSSTTVHLNNGGEQLTERYLDLQVPHYRMIPIGQPSRLEDTVSGHANCTARCQAERSCLAARSFIDSGHFWCPNALITALSP